MSVHIKKRERVIKNGRNRKRRPKTFDSEEKAKVWAQSNIKSGFEIVTLRQATESKKAKVRVIPV